jgi:TRAP transporter 4TM/12TM fusion protein
VLYFTGIFLMIHFEAKKLGLKGLPKESIPNFFKLMLTRGYLFLPIILLVTLMSNGYTPSYAACFAILAAIIVSFFRKDTRFTPKTFVEALGNGSKNTLGVAMACAIAGIIVGVVSLTGLGQVLISVLVSVSGNSLLLALFLTMIACIVLGMGIPTTANYVIMATITAPIVIRMGVPVLAAHMFVFYFGIVADITPPVALAAYAGAAIAKSDPFKTGVNATRLAIAAFIVPYIFVLNPAMLFIDTTPMQVVFIIVTSFIGMVGVSSGMEGYMLMPMKWFERIIISAGGLMLIYPGLITDSVGFTLIAVVVVVQIIRRKKMRSIQQES